MEMETHKVTVCLISADKIGKFGNKNITALFSLQKPRNLFRAVRESPVQF